MNAHCPKCGNRKKFSTVVHVAQDVVVDGNGNFLEEIETTEIVAGPHKDNAWNCMVCGTEAEVED